MHQTRCETTEIIQSGCDLPSAYLTLAYCDFYTYEIRSALISLQHAEKESGRDLAQLSFVQSGIGSCFTNLCEFPNALKHLRQGLEIAERLGDDSRASRILSNLTLVFTAVGQYDDAIRMGCRSIELGKRNINQPELVTAYVNVSDAYLLRGDRARASECLEKAKEWLATHEDWYMTVIFLFENASTALATGNVPLALSVKQEIDRMTGGFEQLHVQGGLAAKLDVVRAFHNQGPETAWKVALDRKTFFESRVPYYYLDALAAYAWIEKINTGGYSRKTIEELEAFETWGATGKRALLQAQGFLV